MNQTSFYVGLKEQGYIYHFQITNAEMKLINDIIAECAHIFWGREVVGTYTIIAPYWF